MGISFIGGVASDTGNSSNADDWSEPIPGSYQANDIALVFVGGSAGVSFPDFTSNAEYTEEAEDNDGVGSDRQANLFYRILQNGADVAPVVSKSVDSRCVGCCLVFRGVDVSVPFDVIVTTAVPLNEQNGPNPAITPITDNGALVLFMYSASAGPTAVILQSDIPTTPSGLSEGSNNLPAYNYSDLVSAYKLDYGSAALITPGDWANFAQQLFEDAQTETDYDIAGDDGDFNGGSGYTQNDTITMTGGATVNADTVDGGGIVLTFTVTRGPDTGLHERFAEVSSTGGTGTGFSLTPDKNNLNSDFSQDVVLMTVALRPASAGGDTNLSMGGIIVTP